MLFRFLSIPISRLVLVRKKKFRGNGRKQSARWTFGFHGGLGRTPRTLITIATTTAADIRLLVIDAVPP